VPRARNWRNLLLCCLLLASKVLDDFSVLNKDFAAIAGLPVARVNQMEAVLLETVQYDVRVNVSTYGPLRRTRRTNARRVLKLPGRVCGVCGVCVWWWLEGRQVLFPLAGHQTGPACGRGAR
jgi:hypothetical protein